MPYGDQDDSGNCQHAPDHNEMVRIYFLFSTLKIKRGKNYNHRHFCQLKPNLRYSQVLIWCTSDSFDLSTMWMVTLFLLCLCQWQAHIFCKNAHLLQFVQQCLQGSSWLPFPKSVHGERTRIPDNHDTWVAVHRCVHFIKIFMVVSKNWYVTYQINQVSTKYMFILFVDASFKYIYESPGGYS